MPSSILESLEPTDDLPHFLILDYVTEQCFGAQQELNLWLVEDLHEWAQDCKVMNLQIQGNHSNLENRFLHLQDQGWACLWWSISNNQTKL